MGFFHHVVDIVGRAVVELVGMVVDLVGLVRGWVDTVGLVEVELVGQVDNQYIESSDCLYIAL